MGLTNNWSRGKAREYRLLFLKNFTIKDVNWVTARKEDVRAKGGFLVFKVGDIVICYM